ncbi:MAG: DNA-3-methyladenine glycosylase I [Armatimonadetes bacterium]|nr:DNA-3-methyladenine glycosylase I [Armatimonadota bacterium]
MKQASGGAVGGKTRGGRGLRRPDTPPGQGLTAAQLRALYTALRAQIAALARRHGGLDAVMEDLREIRARPAGDDRYFEELTRHVFQAGFSWSLIQKKWPGFRQAFAGFSVDRVAAFGRDDVARLLADPGIIRNRAKVEATILNARAFREIRAQHGSFRKYLSSFGVADQARLCRDLRRRFRHIGPFSTRHFLRRVGEDIFISHPDTLRVMYRLGLVGSPKAGDEEAAAAYARLAAANRGVTVGELNRLLTRHGSGRGLDEAICAPVPRCEKCRLTRWCWYYRSVRGG